MKSLKEMLLPLLPEVHMEGSLQCDLSLDIWWLSFLG